MTTGSPTQPQRIRATLAAHRLTGKAGNHAILPGESADDWSVLLVCDEDVDVAVAHRLARRDRCPRARTGWPTAQVGAAGLGWLLAQYRFDRYVKPDDDGGPRVLLTDDAARHRRDRAARRRRPRWSATWSTPAPSDMGPAELEAAAETLAKTPRRDASRVTRGDALDERLSDDPRGRPGRRARTARRA